VSTVTKFVISASRRTDIPAFYMDRFMARIAAGSFRLQNPYNRKVTFVPATPDAVHTIVFWSKNFGPFLDGGYGPVLKDAGYHLFFNFTINPPDPVLEPNVPHLDERLNQLARLCRLTDPLAVNWRFDPVCFYKTADGTVRNNLGGFAGISQQAADSGVRRCVTSFMDHYPKIRRRTAGMDGFEFLDPLPERKAGILMELAAGLSDKAITLQVCCEKEILNTLPAGSRIQPGACVPNDLLVGLFGGRLPLGRDPGQRVGQGCGCRLSVDVGAYDRHPCFHNCLFCYANPRDPGTS
jgi:hypothetical protein